MKIRKGNSFEVLYTAFLADGSAVDLQKVDQLTVKLYHIFNRKSYPVDPLFEDVKLRVKVSPGLPVGDYRLVLNFRFQDESFERDPRVFSIVQNVEDEQAGKTPCGNIDIQTISVSDCISGLGLPGINGKSAYEIWLDEGHVGTPADFLSWLKLYFSELTEEEIAQLQEPAILAAQSAGQTMSEIISVWHTLKSTAESAVNAVNTVKEETVQAKNAAVTATENAVSAKTQALNAASAATEKANFAAEKGSYAKEQGDAAKLAAESITKNWNNNW